MNHHQTQRFITIIIVLHTLSSPYWEFESEPGCSPSIQWFMLHFQSKVSWWGCNLQLSFSATWYSPNRHADGSVLIIVIRHCLAFHFASLAPWISRSPSPVRHVPPDVRRVSCVIMKLCLPVFSHPSKRQLVIEILKWDIRKNELSKGTSNETGQQLTLIFANKESSRFFVCHSIAITIRNDNYPPRYLHNNSGWSRPWTFNERTLQLQLQVTESMAITRMSVTSYN